LSPHVPLIAGAAAAAGGEGKGFSDWVVRRDEKERRGGLDTVPFESIRRSHVTDPCAGTKFESCHGSWGQFVELIFHVTDHSNCLEIVEK
jgi:hypothetical protein